jgi:hypothetical protein
MKRFEINCSGTRVHGSLKILVDETNWHTDLRD